MKRIFRTLSLVALVALVATSCKKNEQKADFNVGFGEVKGFEVGPYFEGNDSKAYFDPNGAFRWNDDDEVMVYNLFKNSANSKCAVYTADPGSAGQSRARFTGEVLGAKGDEGYFLFYHSDKAHAAVTGNDNKETFTVSPTQTYTVNGNEYCGMDQKAMVMACTTEEVNGNVGNFTMQHIFGYLNVGIGGNLNKQVASIVVTDAAWHLTGDLEIKLPEVDAQTLSGFMTQLEGCQTPEQEAAYQLALKAYLNDLCYNASGDLSNSITLNCNNYALPYGQYQYFLISLRPGALYKGFTVRINFTDNSYTQHTWNASMSNLIKPGQIVNVYACASGVWWNGSNWE